MSPAGEIAIAEGQPIPAPEAVARAARDASTLIGKVRELAPGIAARAEEFETARRIPADIAEQLRQIGVFRMTTPRSHGGLELDYPSMLDVLIELATIDGSVGWTSMLGAGHVPHLALLPRQTFDAIYAGGPDVVLAGSAAPAGIGEIVPGGYRVSGRWPFASGCQNANWLFAGFIAARDGKPVPAAPGSARPFATHAVLPAGSWTIEDTWRVAGLKGTGSHHIRLDNVFVPQESTFRYQDDACLEGPLYRSPLHMIPLLHDAPAIGIAEAALRDLVALASTGKRQLLAAEAMRDSPVFQTELGRVSADLRAARAMHEIQARALWQAALAGQVTVANTKLLGDCFQTAAWVTATCVRVVDSCYTLGGGSALYDSSPLQRRLRDIHAASQHVAVQPGSYLRAGASRLGHRVHNPVLDD